MAPDDGPEPPTPEEKEEKEGIPREELEFDALFHRMHAKKGAALNVKDRRYRVKIVKRCFKGKRQTYALTLTQTCLLQTPQHIIYGSAMQVD